MLGAALAGVISEELLGLLHGPMGSGKSTLLLAARTAMGDYAQTGASASLLDRQRPDARYDLAGLAGARLVVATELPEGVRLDGETVKLLGSREPIRARFLYRDFFTYLPTYLVVLATNHRPRVSDTDDGLWRRLREIPFPHAVPDAQQNPRFKLALTDPADREGDPDLQATVLAWLVQGCALWHREGRRLISPPKVVEATADYQREMDPLRDFFETCCRFGKPLSVTVKNLRECYEQYCREEGIKHPLPAKEFNDRLRARKCEEGKIGNHTRIWRGLDLSEPEP